MVDQDKDSEEEQPKKLVEEAEDVEEINEDEIEDEVEEILTSVEEIKEIAAEAGEAIASVYEDKPMLEHEDIKEITDDIVESKLEEQSEDELSNDEPEELEEELFQKKSIPTYTLKELEDEIERDSLTIDTEEERSETIGLSGSEIRVVGLSNNGYHIYEVLYDTDGEEYEGDDLETFDNIVELACYLDDAGYIKVTDLDQYLEECVSKETEISEDTHAQYAKPEGNRVAAYNNALKYAKKNNADYIYGYTNHSGKFFALEQPIKMSEKIGETEKEFRNKYKNCSTVYVAYRDKDFVESIELEETNNAVVDCKIADVITHSEDEKPLDEAIKMTKDELLDKEGTTDVDLINAGRPEEERVELAESVSQEISNAYKQLSKEYGRDIEELVYGPNGFMATKYPNGLPDFRGDIIYSDKYWAEFEEWLEAQDQIKEDLEDDLTDQEFAEQLQARLKEADVNSTNAE